jgi:hypothetical protein
MRKDLPYRDEREFRLIFWPPARANTNASVVFRPNGVRIPVDLDMLIECIYVSPQIRAAERLEKLIEAKGLGCRVVSSVIRENARAEGP